MNMPNYITQNKMCQKAVGPTSSQASKLTFSICHVTFISYALVSQYLRQSDSGESLAFFSFAIVLGCLKSCLITVTLALVVFFF